MRLSSTLGQREICDTHKQDRCETVAKNPQGYESLARVGASGLVAGWGRSFQDSPAAGAKADL